MIARTKTLTDLMRPTRRMHTIGVFLTISSFFFLYPGLFLSAWSFKVAHRTTGTIVDVSMSSLDLILTFWDLDRISFTTAIAGLVLCIFSVALPHVKLLLIVYNFYSDEPIVIGGHYINTKRLVRAFGKYQLIDMYFVTILAAALPNAFLTFSLDPGFYCFYIYCMLSSIGAMITDWVPYKVEIQRPENEEAKSLTVAAGAIFAAFVFWAMFMPVITVSYLFDNYLKVAAVELSLVSILRELSHESHTMLAAFCFFSLIALPLFRVAVVQRALWLGGEHTGNFTDMIHLDVFGVSLVLVYFAINSLEYIFPQLKIVGPGIGVTWGFFSLLMAAISFNEITSRIAPPILSDTQEEQWERVAEEGDQDDNFEAEAQYIGDARSFTKTLFMGKVGICALFFSLWLASRLLPTPVTLSGLQQVGRKNVKFFTQKLQGLLKYINPHDRLTANGHPLYHACVGVGGVLKCHEKGNKVMEVILRNVQGMNSVEVEDMTFGVNKGEVSMTVSFYCKRATLSIFLGLCINPGAIRGVFTGFAQKDEPSCGLINMLDKDHTYEDIHLTLSMTAPCHRSYPFVKSINVSDLVIHTPIPFTLPLRAHRVADLAGFPSRMDQNPAVKGGLMAVAQSWIDDNRPWLPMGDVTFTVAQLVNHIASMNTPDDKGFFNGCLP